MMKLHQNNRVYTGVSLFLIIILILWFFLSKYFFYQELPEHWKEIELPKLTTVVKLRAVYVENSRFKSLSENQIQKILYRSTELVKKHFSVDVEFERKPNKSIQKIFEELPYLAKKHQANKIINISDDDNQKTFKRISDSISLQIKYAVNEEQAIIDYATPYLIEEKKINNVDEFITALTKTVIMRFRVWLNELAEDGHVILDGSAFNQWIYWDILGYGELPYDVIITNQLVASVEEHGMPVHTCLRGGINGGSMTYSKQGLLNGYLFVSAFQMINDNDLLCMLREDERYTEQQVIDYTAATLTHELGHLLFHYAHPFNAQSCIMNPTPLLHYRQWYEKLDVEACQQLNTPMQQPGAAKITYNTQW